MSASIATQVADFNVGFNEAVGPDRAAAFAGEQADLTAAGVPDGAVREGDTVPDAPLTTVDGAPTTLGALTGGGPAVLVFYRGSWCPYCDITLRTYQQELWPALEQRGVRLVAISPQHAQGSQAQVEKGDLGFAVAGDPGLALVRTLGIATIPSDAAQQAHTELGFDVADSNADATRAVPFPTVLVLDGDRTVRFADVRVDYTSRTEVAEVLAAVDGLLVAAG